MKPVAVIAALAGLCLAGAATIAIPQETAINGSVRVVDGDSLVVGGQRVRLYGIDSPELSQTCGVDHNPCGLAAKAALERLIGHDAVACVEKDRDRYGRVVATCSTRAVSDLGQLMVGTGNAVDYIRYSLGRYKDAEDAAKAEHLGIWAGPFTAPAQYRRDHRPR